MNIGLRRALGRSGAAFLALLAFLALAGSGVAQAQTCGTKVLPLTAGVNDPEVAAGTVTVSNDNANLYVTVALASGVTFTNTGGQNVKLWIGNDPANVPKIETLPLEGSFPFKATVPAAQSSYAFTLPFADLSIQDVHLACGGTLYLFLQADVSVGGAPKTAWGGDVFGRYNQWHWYYHGTYVVCCDFGPPPVEKCETAFGKGGYVWTTDPKSNPERLPSLGLTRNRWGWAINMTAPGSLTTPLYAGAGLNRTSNGVQVGTVSIVWNGVNATITYNATKGDLKEVHVYAGDGSPTTVAPGQYGHTQYLASGTTTYTVTLPAVDTDRNGIWVVAHAVACF